MLEQQGLGRLLAAAPDFAPALNYLGYMFAEAGENLPEALTLIPFLALDMALNVAAGNNFWLGFPIPRRR